MNIDGIEFPEKRDSQSFADYHRENPLYNPSLAFFRRDFFGDDQEES
jgi:hypothetical protein